jgi:hypothetical protein
MAICMNIACQSIFKSGYIILWEVSQFSKKWITFLLCNQLSAGWRPRLKHWECGNMLPGQGYRTSQGTLIDEYGITRWEVCSSATWSTRNIIGSHPGLNPKSHDKQPPPNVLSYGAAWIQFYTDNRSSNPSLIDVILSNKSKMGSFASE